MRKAVMIVLALLAIRLLPKALRREARALELLTLLFEMTLAAATSKEMSTEARTAALEVRAGTAAAQLAGNSGFANALGYGPTSTANIGTTSGPDAGGTGFFSFSTGPQIGGAAAHVHNGSLPNLPSAAHIHDFGGHTHDFGGHAHPL